MNDPDDIKLKAEIDKIMTSVHTIIKKIENLNPVKKDDSKQNKD